MKFRTVIRQSGNNTGIEVPEDVMAALGTGKRPPVRVTLKGYTYRNTVAVMGGKYLISVSAELRANAGVAGGETVDVNVELDTEKREVEVPPDFAAALKKDAGAQRLFDGLSYSNKRRLVMAIDAAKAADTRQRRIEKTVANLHEGRA